MDHTAESLCAGKCEGWLSVAACRCGREWTGWGSYGCADARVHTSSRGQGAVDQGPSLVSLLWVLQMLGVGLYPLYTQQWGDRPSKDPPEHACPLLSTTTRKGKEPVKWAPGPWPNPSILPPEVNTSNNANPHVSVLKSSSFPFSKFPTAPEVLVNNKFI